MQLIWFNIILNADRILNLQSSDLNAFALNAAIIMDVIWEACNKVVHHSQPVVDKDLISDCHGRYGEHLKAWLLVDREAGRRWQPSSPGCLKINLDVFIRSNGS